MTIAVAHSYLYAYDFCGIHDSVLIYDMEWKATIHANTIFIPC